MLSLEQSARAYLSFGIAMATIKRSHEDVSDAFIEANRLHVRVEDFPFYVLSL